MISLTWLGHAAFRFDLPSGDRIYVDPFLTGNPSCPASELEPERLDAILVTHGHDDHVGDTVRLARAFACPVIAQVELRRLLGEELGGHMTQSLNKGGGVDLLGSRVTLTHANHSSSYGTFSLLTGTPEAMSDFLPEGIELIVPAPGKTVNL